MAQIPSVGQDLWPSHNPLGFKREPAFFHCRKKATLKFLKYIVAAVVLIIALLAMLAPIGPLPGIFIGGSASAAPRIWQDTSQVDEVRLRVAGAVPRVVIIWVVQQDNQLYVIGSNESGWVTMLGQGGPVHLRIGDATYPLLARKLTEEQLPIIASYQNKYRAGYPAIVGDMGAPEDMINGASVYLLARE